MFNVLNVLEIIFWFVVTLGVLVTFHEFGHFVVARRCGVKVLRFSVGFGPPLWSHKGKDGTDYWIAPIPLGGYNKFLDAREGEVPEEDRHREYTAQPVWKRIAIAAAGPAFNLIFAVLAFWVMFMVGRPGLLPVIGAPQPQTLAAEAGFQAGDVIQSVNGHEVQSWMGVFNAIGSNAMAHRDIPVRVRRSDGSTTTLQLDLAKLPSDLLLSKAIPHIGLNAPPVPAVIGMVEPDMPAASAGLRAGDQVLAVNGQKIPSFAALGKTIQSLASHAHALQFRIRRGDSTLTIPIQPKWTTPSGATSPRWMIGVGRKSVAQPTTLVRYGPVKALGQAFVTTWDKTANSFEMLGRMLSGQASTRNLSGVITIARVAKTTAQRGVAWYLSFLGLISLSLAVINLLPIPLLDGGHLVYYLIELAKGSPVSERIMIAGQFVGMALIAGLIGLAFYNDILRLVP